MKNIVWNLLFKLENNSIYTSIKKGLMITFLIFLIGSLSRLINAIPLDVVQDIIMTWQGGVIHTSLHVLQIATEKYISLILLITISYYYTIGKMTNPILILMSIVTTFVDFLIAINILTSGRTYLFLGIPGMLLAISIAIASTYFFHTIIKIITKKIPLSNMGCEENLKISFISVIPMLLTLIKGTILFIFFNSILKNVDFYDVWITFLLDMYHQSDSGILHGILYIFSVNMSWFFGVHGGLALEPVITDVLIPATTNPSCIISKGFLETFVHIGGSGSLLCLVFAMMYVSKCKKENVTMGLFWTCMLVPFNISELLVFGFPIILNPIMLVPFILVPIISFLIAYLATIIGFLPIVNQSLIWTIPVGFSGYYSVNSIRGVIVQIIVLIIGTLIYIPFVQLYKKFSEEKEARILDLLIDDFTNKEKEGILMPLLSRSDYGGQVAKNVAKQLRYDIEHQNIELYFQPQHNVKDEVIGAEALLRWKYHGKMLYPPFVIALANEESVAMSLSLESLRIVIEAIETLKKAEQTDIHISMNFSALQINDNLFVMRVIDVIKCAGVEEHIYLELTEETSIQGLPNLSSNIEKLSNNGIAMAIDDFGMGQTSLGYLKENKFKYVKFDKVLIENLLEEPRSAEIISSIIHLGQTLNFEVIAEYVETKELKNFLMVLGCHIYQGYYYSPAIPINEFIVYANKN